MLVKEHGKDYADKVAELKGLRSLWWQLNNETGPHARLLWVLLKIACCAAYAIFLGLVPLPFQLAIILIALILIPIL